MEDKTGLQDQGQGSFCHSDGNCGPDEAQCVANASRLSEADDQLLEALAFVVQTSAPFSFSILTNTLSVTEQLDFGYKLIVAAGRIRTRVEKTCGDHRFRPTDGDAP